MLARDCSLSGRRRIRKDDSKECKLLCTSHVHWQRRKVLRTRLRADARQRSLFTTAGCAGNFYIRQTSVRKREIFARIRCTLTREGISQANENSAVSSLLASWHIRASPDFDTTSFILPGCLFQGLTAAAAGGEVRVGEGKRG